MVVVVVVVVSAWGGCRPYHLQEGVDPCVVNGKGGHGLPPRQQAMVVSWWLLGGFRWWWSEVVCGWTGQGVVDEWFTGVCSTQLTLPVHEPLVQLLPGTITQPEALEPDTVSAGPL